MIIEPFSTWFIFAIFVLVDAALLPDTPYFVIQTLSCKTNKCCVRLVLIVLRAKKRHNLNSSSWNAAKRTGYSAVRLEVDSKLLAWECKHLPKQPFSDYFQDFFLWKKTTSDFSFELGQKWLLIIMSFNVFIRNQQRCMLIKHYVNKIESFSTWFIFTIFILVDAALLPGSPYFVIQTFSCKTNKCYVIPMLIVLRAKKRHNLNSSSWNEAKRTITRRWITGKIANCWHESVSTCQSSLFQSMF